MRKTKYLTRMASFLLVVLLCVALIPFGASAATTTPYYKTYGSYYKTNSDDPTVSGSPDCFDIYMYGSLTNGSGTLYDYATINWDHVTIYLDSHGDYDYGIWFRIIKDGEDYVFDNMVNLGNSDRVLYSGSLPDGEYEVTYLSHKEENFLFVYWSTEYHYNYHFTLDTTAPTISGASTSIKYTNSSFTVSASDATSGVKTFWYAEPGDEYYKAASGTSVTIPAGSAKGYYHFYATDNAGNKSAYHYVYYDNERPTGSIKNTSGTVLTGTYTNAPFKYVASDAHSGISYCQYKKPGSSSWQNYSSGSTIAKTAGDGLYQFRAFDRCGNVTYTQSIRLDATSPVGVLYADSDTVDSGESVVAEHISYIAEDNLSGVNNCYVKKPGSSSYVSYTSGTQLTTPGTYYFYCTDNAGNRSETYNVTLLDDGGGSGGDDSGGDETETYTVTYDANGGSNAPASQTKTKGIPLVLTSLQPTRTGYRFLGWSTSRSASYATYSSGGTYSTDASVTLYAVWQKRTYTVSYDANGGIGAPPSQIKTYGEALTLSSTMPTRSGFSFLGWSSSSTATTPSYYSGGTFSGNYSITLYAVWGKDAGTYTVTYNANGGTGAPSAQIKTEDVTLYLSSTIPSRQHYSFLGWGTSANSTTAIYSPGDSYTSNSSVTLYAVWEYSPESYTIRYNANGGSGAPTAQVKTAGVAITLSSIEPLRERYTFLGWSTDAASSAAEYMPGDRYTTDESTTLYAVWEKNNYEFSLSDLTVSESEIYRYETVAIKVRTDSWDRVNAYNDIPVQLYYDGRLLGTQYVDFSAYGVAYVTFNLNVGDSVGEHSIEVRINWSDRIYETDSTNNSVTGSVTVKDYDYEMVLDPVTSAGYYCEGMDVITSFYVANNSDYDIIPGMRNTARFTAYYYNGSTKVVIASDDWENVVIPAHGTNLVYFKWTVPTGISGKTVYLKCEINADRYMNEVNYDNNIASFTTTISAATDSQTPDTRFESEAPNSYQSASTPSVSTDKATWTMWEYENGSFVLKRYGIQISSVSPVVTPSSDCVTAVYENGKWTMRSGYGITMSYAPTISTVSGYNRPDSNAYTSVQYVVATFPEFRYYDTDGNCRTLEYVGGKWQFTENSDADGNARVHFIPVYVKDGNYTVSVTATHVWTPAGMIEATRSANVIIIDGTIYDDWYQG